MSKVLDDLIAAIEGLREGDGFTFSLISKVAKKANAALPTLLALQAALCAPVARFTIEEVLDIVRKSEGMLVTINEHGHTHFVSGKGLARHIKPMLESAQPVIIIATEGK